MKAFIRAGLYWHTLRFLKPVQLYGRIRFALLPSPLRSLSGKPVLRKHVGTWNEPAERPLSMLQPDRFIFLGQENRITAKRGWNDPSFEKLWLYNLHYFDDLNGTAACKRREMHAKLIERWISENPPTSGVGWEPYPTSLRIVNWVKWLLAGNAPPPGCVGSLFLQTRWLRQRLEWHLLGNHLFANAKALIFGGLFFDGIEADEWLSEGVKIVTQQIPEQVLTDGGHVERSTMYHAIVLEDLLDLVNASTAFSDHIEPQFVAVWKDTAQRMLLWLDGMTHPDGEIALFNDAAFKLASSSAVLHAYTRRLGIEPVVESCSDWPQLTWWQVSGYIRISAPRAVAILDVAPLGADHLSGHAHADTLSFELSIQGQRAVVNGGTSRYGTGPERTLERATSSHSTVELDGESSSEVWSGFRVARRARPFDLEVQKRDHSVSVACSHDGYKRLAGQPVHRRMWDFDVNRMRIRDTITGRRPRAVARYIFHPEVRVTAVSASSWILTLPAGQRAYISVQSGEGRLEPARLAPEFGKVLQTQCLAVVLDDGFAMTEINWD